MNKPLTKEQETRFKKCIIGMRNKQHLYDTTGIATHTIDRILKRRFADEEQIKTLEDYCDQVEGVVTEKKA